MDIREDPEKSSQEVTLNGVKLSVDEIVDVIQQICRILHYQLESDELGRYVDY